MNALVLADRAADWRRLKALVLDSVSSPITRRVYNLGAGRIHRVVRPGAAARLQQGDGQRLARGTRGPRPRLRFHQRADHGGPEAGGRGCRQRAAGAGVGRRHHAREGRAIQRRPSGQLAVVRQAQTLLNAPDIAHEERAARPGDPGGAARLRTAAVRGGGAHVRARSAAGRSLVHRRSPWEARPGTDGPDAERGSRWRSTRGPSRPASRGNVFRPVNRATRCSEPHEREGRLADAQAVRRGGSVLRASHPHDLPPLCRIPDYAECDDRQAHQQRSRRKDDSA